VACIIVRFATFVSVIILFSCAESREGLIERYGRKDKRKKCVGDINSDGEEKIVVPFEKNYMLNGKKEIINLTDEVFMIRNGVKVWGSKKRF
jgi:hypothetical protein